MGTAWSHFASKHIPEHKPVCRPILLFTSANDRHLHYALKASFNKIGAQKKTLIQMTKTTPRKKWCKEKTHNKHSYINLATVDQGALIV